MITVRTADIKDAELIADMSRQTFFETFAPQNTKENMDKFMNETFTKEALMKEVGAAGNYFLLAYDEEIPVGYARMREGELRPEFDGKSSIEIARIYAVASAIGKGVGSTLIKKCIEIAGEMDKETIWLGVWEKNQRAIEFYGKWGFEKFGTHVFLLGNDPQTDWLMKKELATGD
ncbi:MAG: GNAT family N-acetyltransferase [Sphingobacteriales bacterium]|nr:GNAT family N-acetyltransferase [Sphingobacteriales bacterium]